MSPRTDSSLRTCCCLAALDGSQLGCYYIIVQGCPPEHADGFFIPLEEQGAGCNHWSPPPPPDSLMEHGVPCLLCVIRALMCLMDIGHASPAPGQPACTAPGQGLHLSPGSTGCFSHPSTLDQHFKETASASFLLCMF